MRVTQWYFLFMFYVRYADGLEISKSPTKPPQYSISMKQFAIGLQPSQRWKGHYNKRYDRWLSPDNEAHEKIHEKQHWVRTARKNKREATCKYKPHVKIHEKQHLSTNRTQKHTRSSISSTKRKPFYYERTGKKTQNKKKAVSAAKPYQKQD